MLLGDGCLMITGCFIKTTILRLAPVLRIQLLIISVLTHKEETISSMTRNQADEVE